MNRAMCEECGTEGVVDSTPLCKTFCVAHTLDMSPTSCTYDMLLYTRSHLGSFRNFGSTTDPFPPLTVARGRASANVLLRRCSLPSCINLNNNRVNISCCRHTHCPELLSGLRGILFRGCHSWCLSSEARGHVGCR